MPQVCAHINPSPYQQIHKVFDSVQAVKDYLRHLDDNGIISRDSRYNPRDPEQYHYVAVDVYPRDPSNPCACTDRMNFHDYPASRYTVGMRGGIRKLTV